jgi:hypothetical protein
LFEAPLGIWNGVIETASWRDETHVLGYTRPTTLDAVSRSHGTHCRLVVSALETPFGVDDGVVEAAANMTETFLLRYTRPSTLQTISRLHATIVFI